MEFPVQTADGPPASVVAYIEDMLNELAEMALEAGEPMLAPAIRAAANAAAEAQGRRQARQAVRPS